MDSTSHSTVSRDELQLEMLRELQREDVADWYTLGVMLNIPKRKLDIIEISHNNLNRRIIELLCEWFNHEDNPSWEKLGKALKDTHCHRDQGISILKKYCPHVLNHYPLPPRVSHRPVLLERSGDSNTEDIPYSLLPNGSTEPPSFYSSQTPINPHRPPYSYFPQYIPEGYPLLNSLYEESIHSLSQYHIYSHPPSHSSSPYSRFHPYGYPPTPRRNQQTTQPLVTEPVHNLVRSEQMKMPVKPKSTDTPIVEEDQLHSNLEHGEQIIKHEFTPNQLQISTADTTKISDHLEVSSTLKPPLPQATLPTVNASSKNKVLKPTGETETLSKDHPLSFCSYCPSPNPSMLHTIPMLPAIHIQDFENKEALLEQHKYNLSYTRLISKFGCLKFDVQEIFEKDGIEAERIKRYLSRMKSLPVDIHNPFSFLEENSPELEKASSIDEIFTFLDKYMSFDNCTLLESLVDKFLPQSDGGTLISEYNHCLEQFLRSCPSEMLAMVYQQNISQSPHLNKTSVSIHFDHSWQTRPAQHFKDFQQIEFHHSYIPPSSLKTLTCEKRSIFIIWETTSKVIQELSKDCVKRFSHFRRQGVLQFIIGTLEMDFSTSKSGPPEVFRIEEPKGQLTRAVSKSALHGSMMTLQSEQSQDSRKTGSSGESGRTGESGYGSGHVPSIDNLPVAISSLPVPESVLDIYPEIEVLSSFSSISGEKNYLSVQKGQKVRCLNVYEGWACVVNSDNKRGYIPADILRMPAKMMCAPRQSTPLPYSPSKQTISEESISVLNAPISSQPFVIVRRKVSLSELNISASVAPTKASEIDRPDTPPILAQMEALEISLSSDRNSKALDPFRSDQNQTEAIDPEISLPTDSKFPHLRFIDEVDTKSFSKSLKQDLHQYQEEPERVARISLIRKLRNVLSRDRRGDSKSEIRSLVSSKTQMTTGSETASKKSRFILKMKKHAYVDHDFTTDIDFDPPSPPHELSPVWNSSLRRV